MWRRSLWVLAVLILALSSARSPARAQPDCADPSVLAAGSWRGSFAVSWTARWTAVLQVPGRAGAPATWEHTQTVEGEIDLFVAASVKDGAPPVSGGARAQFRTRSMARRDDGASAMLFGDLRLSGGALTTPSGPALPPGDTVEWHGAALTGGFASTWVNYSGPDGRPLLHGDGRPIEQPVGPILFRVLSAECGAISGVVEGLGFDRFWLGREAGLLLATPTLGAATDLTILEERATFRITHPRP